MSDNDGTTSTEQEAPKPAPPAAKQEVKDELPDWARQQISSANQEAANYRVQLKEAKTANASLQEQVASLTTEKSSTASVLASVQSDFDRLAVAIKSEVPLDHVFSFAKTLQGSTEEELSAHAEQLKSMFNIKPVSSPAVDRSQGHGAGSNQADPADVFAKLLQSNLTR